MGILRLLFALSVLIEHAGSLFGYNIANSWIAVTSFFIMSGFYMSLILDKKYTGKHSLQLFYSNRILRIFPLYLASLLLIFLFILVKYLSGVGGEDNAIVHYIHWSAYQSLLQFWVDLINFVLRNLTLIFTLDYFRVNDSTPGYLLVQQAWTLQIELLFYVLIPFVMRLPRKYLLGIFVVYAVGFFGILEPRHLLPNTLTFVFLKDMIFFFFGIFVYTFLYKNIEGKKIPPAVLRLVFAAIVTYLFFYIFLPFKFPIAFLQDADIVWITIFSFAMPFIFRLTNKNRLDEFFGFLSYPVYILHFFVIKLLANISLYGTNANTKTIVVICLTVLLSYLAVMYIEKPINSYRQRRVRK